MKFYKEYVLISILFRTLDEVQGKSNGQLLRSEALPSSSIKFIGQGNLFPRNRATVNYFTENDIGNEYLKPLQRDSIKKTPTVSDFSKSSIFKAKSSRYRAGKSHAAEVPKLRKISEQDINAKETLKLILPVRRAFPTQKIYCRQITKRELNSQGDIIESVQHICAPLARATGKGQPIPTPTSYITTEKMFGSLVSSTPKGINCRRIMNSEFNELGEIVDSVREVCDPPPTTTTTRKPITTPKVTTTTPKPLVKVCRPVMDSYLNEEGKIIDSVNMVCKMEQAT